MSGKKAIFNILVSIIVIVAAVFAYRFFFPKPIADPKTPALEPLGLASGNTQNNGQDEFLRLLLSLQAIDFETDLFDTMHQGSFQDFTVELVAKTPGRPNPFAPIGGDERGFAKATTTATTTSRR